MAMEENGEISSNLIFHSQSGRTQLSQFRPITDTTHQTKITHRELSIEIDEALANSMNKKLEKFSGSDTELLKPATIFRVPEYIRNKNKELYEPQIVSIGPYHHGAERLRAMEEQKWRYLNDLLARSREAPELVSLVKQMRILEDDARRAYSESFSFRSDEFVEMMVLDGCFIIEFLLKSSTGESNAMGVISIGHSDLFLLENQVPFFIISSLYSILGPHNHTIPLEHLLSHFMFNDSSKKLKLPNEGHIYHLLHLHYYLFVPEGASTRGRVKSPSVFQRCSDCLDKYRTLLQSSFSSHSPESNDSIAIGLPSFITNLKLTTRAPAKVIPCACSLREAGIRFKRKKSPDNMFHVTFEDGILEIPSVLIDSNRKRLFLNLIAFEQSDRSIQKNLTSFATLMDMLINTPSDVTILERSNILHNMLPSSEEAACFFNQICDCAILDYDNHYLACLFQEVRDYCASTWHRNRARLVRDYFHNPWSILSLIAAITLLIFSSMQTFFSAFAYFRPPHTD